MKYNDENYIERIVDYLELLKQVYDDDAMPTMIDESNNEERVEDIEALLKFINKTN